MCKLVRAFATAAFALMAAGVFASEATVVAVVGKAEVQKGAEWVALNVGDSVEKGAVISTGFKSELLLKVNESNIKMGALTRLTVEQLTQSASANKTSLFIDSGKVNVEVNKSGNKREDFKVSSPVATASVRGTSFTFGSDGTLTTHSGLVAKGQSTRTSASVASDDDDAAFIAKEDEGEKQKKANAFTSSFEKGTVPVYAGQTSKSDAVTGRPVPAYVAAAQSAAPSADGTGSLASKEGMSHGDAPGGMNTPQKESSQQTAKKASVSITVNFDD